MNVVASEPYRNVFIGLECEWSSHILQGKFYVTFLK